MLRQCLIFSQVLFFVSLAGCGDSDRGAEFTQTPAGEEVFRISNDEEEVDLILTTNSVYLQLSERVLTEIKDELNDERSETEGSALADGIKNMVLDGVETMVRTTVEYDIDEIRDIQWKDGEMIFDIEEDGLVAFEDIEINGGRPVLETFERDDALEFIAEFNRVKGRII